MTKASERAPVPALELPDSSFLSEESLASLRAFEFSMMEAQQNAAASDGSLFDAEFFYQSSAYASLTRRYEVDVRVAMLGGVDVEEVTPRDGVPPENQNRVLVNLHGGGFESGSRTMSHLESIPIAALGKIKVVSVDYRMAPEHQHPAGRDDAVAVYQALLEHYPPENIGIYGTSAGGVLTSQVIAWLLREKRALPAAVGMFCAAAYGWSMGDSATIGRAISKQPVPVPTESEIAYFKDANVEDPTVFVGSSREHMAGFPPSLLITSSRDNALSSVIATHTQLASLGVRAELYVWEGLDHAFLLIPDLPEAREASRVIAAFFDRHLGR